MIPVLFKIGPYPIFTYPLFIGMAWGIGYRISRGEAIKNNISSSLFHKFVIGIFLSAWLGAKIFFIIFSSPISREKLLVEVNFWMGGGFVFYGGLLGALIFAFIFFKQTKKFSTKMRDSFLLALCIGHGVGRIGCFLTGCCYGERTLLYKNFHLYRHPVQLYEAICLFILYFILKNRVKNQVLAIYLISYGIIRFLLEFLRGDTIRGIYYGLSTSQWVSVVLFFLGIWAIIRPYSRERLFRFLQQ